MFVIERVDELGDEAANRMLKTLEEPAPFVHLILLTERPSEVLPTISSRCQLVRFDAPGVESVAAELRLRGTDEAEADALARIALGDGELARTLATQEGRRSVRRPKSFARCALSGELWEQRPWHEILVAARGEGEALQGRVGRPGDASRLELLPQNEPAAPQDRMGRANQARTAPDRDRRA